MKNSIIFLCLTFLFAAFMLSCQQQESGPTGPEALQTLAKKPVEAKFDVTFLTGNFLKFLPEKFKDNIGDRRAIIVQNATLNFNTFFDDKLSCPGEFSEEDGEDLDLTGVFVLHSGSKGNGHAFLNFQFTHPTSGIFYTLELWGKILSPDNWPPSSGSNTMENETGGHWKLKATGRNNQNGCTGEGDGILFTIEVDPIPIDPIIP